MKCFGWVKRDIKDVTSYRVVDFPKRNVAHDNSFDQFEYLTISQSAETEVFKPPAGIMEMINEYSLKLSANVRFEMKLHIAVPHSGRLSVCLCPLHMRDLAFSIAPTVHAWIFDVTLTKIVDEVGVVCRGEPDIARWCHDNGKGKKADMPEY